MGMFVFTGCGLLELSRTDTAKMYVNAVYRYSKANKEFYVTNISMDQLGLYEGDVLLKINGKKVTKENINFLLDKHSSMNYNKQVIFDVKRNKQILKLTGPPLIIDKNQKNLISVEKKVDREKVKIRKIYVSGSKPKNYPYKIQQ